MLDWQQIDTVLLDMDGTLLDLHFDSHFWLEHLPIRYADIHAIELAEARSWLHQRLVQEQGTLNWYCLDYWSEVLNVDIAALKHEVADKIAFRPGVRDFLLALRQMGKRVVIVTNAHQDSLSLKLSRTGLDQQVDRVICSHDYGCPKEEQAFWQRLQQEEPFVKERTLLVDDSLSVLRSAAEYGVGFLLAVSQPDSQQAAKDVAPFTALDDFEDISPRKN